jgi:hypothetical protein
LIIGRNIFIATSVVTKFPLGILSSAKQTDGKYALSCVR